MYALPTAPMGIGRVLDGAFRLTASSFSRVWYIALLSTLASLMASIYQFSRGVSGQQALLWKGDGIYWVLYCAGIFVSIVLYSTVILRQHAIASGEPVDGKVAVAARRFLSVLVASILWALPTVVAVMLVTVSALMGSAGLAFGLGVILFVPVILFLVSLSFNQVIVLVEHKGPIVALRDSHKLVWGNWWRTFALFLIALVIIFVLYILMAFVIGIVMQFTLGKDVLLRALATTAVATLVVSTVLTPFGWALLLSVYYDLKLRRQGGDLAARVGALAT